MGGVYLHMYVCNAFADRNVAPSLFVPPSFQPGGREVLVSPSLWLNTLPGFSTNLPGMCQNAPQAGALLQGASKYKFSTGTVARVSADGALEPLLQTATAQPSSAA